MSEDYLQELKEAGLLVKLLDKNQGLIYSKNRQVVGFYDTREKPPIRVGFSPEHGNNMLEEEIKSAELLKKRGIPYYIYNKRAIEQVEREISEKQNLLKRMQQL